MMIKEKHTEQIEHIKTYKIRLLHDVECYDHIHYRAEIVLVQKGTLTIKHHSEEFLLTSGEAMVIMPYEIHAYRSEKGTKTLILEFDRMQFPEFSYCADPKNRIFKPKSDTLAYITALLCNEHRDEIYLKTMVYALLLCMHLDPKNIPVSDNRMFYAALDYIEHTFTEKISLKTASATIGCSYSYLSRIFSAFSGIGFTTYLNRYRILASLSDLKQSNLNISEIAFKNGFETLRSYHREFRKIFHTTPGEYRKNGYSLNEEY